jgi:hypothetical protein
MSRLLLLALAGAAAWLGWRALRRQSQQVVEALKRADASLHKRAPVRLEKDPETGVYRPAKSGE